MKELNTYHEHPETPRFPDSLRVNPFTVPENYFREASSVLMSTLAIEKTKSTNPFSVPDRYFETLSQQLKAQAMLPQPSRENGMEVPDDYFSELTSDIRMRLSEARLKETVHDTGFTVPQHYFQQAEEQLARQISLERRSTSLSHDAFIVQPGYFDQLSSQILGRVREESNASAQTQEAPETVRPIGTAYWRMPRIFAAASIAAILFIGAFFGLNRQMPGRETDSMAAMPPNISLEHIPDDEIVHYLAMDNGGLDYLVEYITTDAATGEPSITEVADQDLEEYIKLMLE